MVAFTVRAGYRNYGDGSVNNSGSNGNYWSSTVNDADNAWNMNFNSGNVNADNNNNRANGLSLRCLVELYLKTVSGFIVFSA